MDGNDLLRRREALGLNQSELARRLGVSRNAIWRWETGKARIQHPQMMHLALWAIEKQNIWRDLMGALAKDEGDS